MDNKAKFIDLFQKYVPNSEELIRWLKTTDFFIAPASTKYHGNYEGGLVEHSLNVFYLLNENPDSFHYDVGTIVKVALLHDLCKIDLYKKDYRNVKVNGVWEQVPFYKAEDDFPYGHGEKSVYLAQKYIDLTDEEAMAIRWHMGGFDQSVQSGYNISNVFEKYPLALELHIADMRATYYLDKKV